MVNLLEVGGITDFTDIKEINEEIAADPPQKEKNKKR